MIRDQGATGTAPGPRDERHWVEVLLNRMEQLEFTLSRETGIEGEILGAVGELGARIDTLDQQLAAGTAHDIGQVIAVFDALNTHLAAGRLPAAHNQAETMALVVEVCRQASDDVRHLSDLIVATSNRPAGGVDPATLRFTAGRVLGRLLSAMKRLGQDQRDHLADLGERIDAIARRLGDVPATERGSPADAAVTDALGTLIEQVDLLRRRDVAQPDLAPLKASVDTLSAWLDTAVEGSDRRLDALGDRLTRIEARLDAQEQGAGAMTAQLDALGSRLAERLDRGLDRLAEEIRTTRAPAGGSEVATDQRRSIARLMTALNAWSSRQEVLHERTGAMLAELLACLGDRAAGGAFTDAGRDALLDAVRSAIDAQGDRIDSVVQDVQRQVIALRQSGEIDRIGARVATALSGLARSVEARTDAIGTRLDALANRLPSLPDDPGIADDLRLAAAAQALHVRLSQLADAPPDRAFDAVLDDRRRALRVAVAEALARAERHLS